MNTAAPERTPPRRIRYKISKKLIDPPCLGEALMRVIIISLSEYRHPVKRDLWLIRYHANIFIETQLLHCSGTRDAIGL